jgi:hypothetical protein
MRLGRPAAILAPLVALVLAVGLAASAGAAAEVTFGPPRAEGAFGEGIVFSTTFTSDERPARVELLSRVPGQTSDRVTIARVEPTDAGWRASVRQGGHVVPNTSWEYRFRAVTDEGVVTGPTDTYRLLDTRFEWDVLEGDRVNVWTYEGGEAFATRALETAEEALSSTAELLGIDVTEPVDFVIYTDMRTFREAMGPATRENIEGQAHLGIRTLFALVEPRGRDSERTDEVIAHELAHLVFHDAVANPYQYPPRWLNEGVAVYVSEGYPDSYRSQVRGAAAGETIIPLEGLGGHFPTRATRQSLAYAESIDAVDHLVETYGEPALVELIHAFGDGLGLDGAFLAATGEDFSSFDAAWLASLGAEAPEPYGPQPVTPGPSPEAWASRD